jgi:hypothetical protein
MPLSAIFQLQCCLISIHENKKMAARWFSPGTPTSSTNKTGCHDIAEILLKVVLNTKIHIQIQTRSVIGRIVPERKPPTMGKQLVTFITCGCE